MTPSIWSLFKWSSQSISHPDVLSRCDNWCAVVTHSSSIAVSLFLNPRYSSTLCSTNSRLQIHRHRILGPLCFLDWNCALLWVGAEKHAFASRSCFDPTESQLRMSLSRADRWLRAMTSRLGTILTVQKVYFLFYRFGPEYNKLYNHMHKALDVGGSLCRTT